jgi:hypothetical protein
VTPCRFESGAGGYIRSERKRRPEELRPWRLWATHGSAFYDHSIDGGATWSLGGRIGVKVEF